ncbi:sensor histidine kinase [Brevundimonas sp.]|jgi:signal transduction histidine kinase|uniref:sensor histidine kinase n=1 Tax=Brevundimonas sp. TaxID=1871086 RepID=UPI0017A4087F|nr:sensor histidine kinase [Brevundimonas sp.]MBA4809144.1 MASE1 domain-containing protein [Brevundimonas sp.]
MTMSRVLDINVAKPPPTRAPTIGVPAGDPKGGDVFAHPLIPVLTGVVVAILAALAISWARSVGLIAGIWGVGGVAVAVWLRTSRGPSQDAVFALVLTISILIGELIAGNKPALSMLFTLANMLEIVAAVLLARRFAPALNVSSLKGAAGFLIFGAILAPIPAGLFASVGLLQFGAGDIVDAFKTWWFGHAIGLATIGTLGLSLTRSTFVRLRQPGALLEAGLLLTTVLTVQCVGITQRSDVGIVMIPLLLCVAVRTGVAGTAFSLLVVALLSVIAAMFGYGPYSAEGLSHQVMMAQVQVLVAYMPILLVAALLEERDGLAERARLGQVRAELASEAKSRLLANVAHEIKSPVAGVIGIGQLWSSGQLGAVTPQQTEMADMLVKTARQVEALAHDLLDVARAEAGTVKVELRPTDVPGLLDDVRRSAVLRPEAQSVKLEVVCEGDGLIALADSQRLMQVINNLVTNALKYGGAGGRVVLRARWSGDRIRIEVTDFGPGLSEQKQKQLFEPFNRLGLERSTIEGHGVGLAIAKRLVELQGGAIGVISSAGQGATFWVDLPRA